MPTINWTSKLATVAGKGAPKIEKAFGFRTVRDLLRHYPRQYVAKGDLSDGSDFVLDEHVTVIAEVVSAKQVAYDDRRRGGVAYRLEVVVATQTDRLSLTFFDKHQRTADWRRRSIVPGRQGLFSGKVGRFRDRWQLVNPETRIYSDESTEGGVGQALAEWQRLPGLLPIYPATSTVQTWQIQDAVAVALDLLEEVPETLPARVRLRRGLVSARQALAWIHRPESWQEKGAGEKRLRFEEAFVTQIVMAQRRWSLTALDAEPRNGVSGGLLDRFDEQVPFRLTAGQHQVGAEILDDLASGHPMHRLLQGDVGSGKTVVALRAMLRVVDSGGQAALLAPTEVLAVQHHRSITALLGDLAAGGMLGSSDQATRVALVTGSQGSVARKAALDDVDSGAAGLVIGTHALLQESVSFADLGLVVVDEQHRFGVEQRFSLTVKGGRTPPHVLVMTATPIPRTVAMTVFGDLETSTLRELPAGRAQTQTSVVPVHEHPTWLARAWARVREEAAQGRQTYVVCPRIRPDAAVDSDLAAVEDIAPALSSGPLHGLRVEVLHGRLPGDHKDAVMQSFGSGGVDVLVSTTVIEVGVDIPTASVMVILDADRFGVSTLHQLRGRVGRGGTPGLCLLVTRAEAGSAARARLDAVATTSDGFELSRVDLEQRREGDVLGAAQSGRRSALRLLSVIRHEDVILDAREAATTLVESDPHLDAEPALAAAVHELVESEQADYLEKA